MNLGWIEYYFNSIPIQVIVFTDLRHDLRTFIFFVICCAKYMWLHVPSCECVVNIWIFITIDLKIQISRNKSVYCSTAYLSQAVCLSTILDFKATSRHDSLLSVYDNVYDHRKEQRHWKPNNRTCTIPSNSLDRTTKTPSTNYYYSLAFSFYLLPHYSSFSLISLIPS